MAQSCRRNSRGTVGCLERTRCGPTRLASRRYENPLELHGNHTEVVSLDRRSAIAGQPALDVGRRIPSETSDLEPAGGLPRITRMDTNFGRELKFVDA